jgi:putative membrane protein
MASSRTLFVLLGAVSLVFVWSGIEPRDRLTWLLEVAPALIGLGVLAATYRRFPLTRLTYVLIAIHAMILCIGGKYTYAEVPAFDWVAEVLGRTRNDYDKVGHFWQGFGPAIVAREVILRTSPLRPGKWLFFLVLCFALAVSAVYELIEWWVALLSDEAADAFLGTQGDVWDTQKDMFTCGLGATCALLGLSKQHDRELLELTASSRGAAVE